jgi:BioD-like phosphotransacetylase family protein
MTFVDLQKSVSELPVDEQDKLAAYLTMLRKSRDPEWNEKISDRLNDQNKDNWVSLEELGEDD